MAAKRHNRSRAAAEHRVAPKNEGFDDFPTPPWATRAVCEFIDAECIAQGWQRPAASTVWEPAANRGYMVRPLQEYFASVEGTDVKDYGAGFAVEDFLVPTTDRPAPDWILTNPPFRLGAEFIERMALLEPHCGYGVLVRTAFLESEDRYDRIFRRWPPSIVAQYVERVPMFEGVYDPTGSKPNAFCWMLWFRHWTGPSQIRWIRPAKHRLLRPSDRTAPFSPTTSETA